MKQYVKWDFTTNSILRGPQVTFGEGDDWFPLIEAGKVVNPKTQKVDFRFDATLNSVIAEVVGSPKLLYDQARQYEYPSLMEQLDMLWHDINNDTLDKTGSFYNHIKSVKENNPK